MDGHHPMPLHGHDPSPYQNGYNAGDEFGNVISNGGDSDHYANWFDTASHIPSQNAQSDPYMNWQLQPPSLYKELIKSPNCALCWL